MRFHIVGNPEDRRVSLLQSALERLGLRHGQVISYPDLIKQRITLPEVVRAGDVIRIESPGQCWETKRLLLAVGAEAASHEPFLSISAKEAQALSFQRGRIWYPRQWYLGYCHILDQINAQLAQCPPYQIMNSPEAIKGMFDKSAAHARLEAAEVPVPPALADLPRSYAGLRAAMCRAGWSQVFIKPAHGSSASGVIAYRVKGKLERAVTTVEFEDELLYNSLRLQVYDEHAIIVQLIDAMLQRRAHVERWLPKAGIDDYIFDLRVVVILGQAMHVVPRMSRSPLTNLHLANTRGDAEQVRALMGEAGWHRAMAICEQAAACFPGCFYAGVDLLILPRFRRYAVAEINAFGDLLPDLLYAGVDTYTAEVMAMCSPEKLELHNR